MSADNYGLIRKHPNGGFAIVMGFASSEETPEVRPDQPSYPTVEAALRADKDSWYEYGISVHQECWEDETSNQSLT